MNTDNLALRPNCLLTKYPLVFVTGPRSLFHYEKLGHDLQDFIVAHGYQVLPLHLPFRSVNLRKKTLMNWLSKNEDHWFHFIMAAETYSEFKYFFESIDSSNQESTLTIINTYPLSNTIHSKHFLFKVDRQPWWRIPLSYRLHKFLCQFSNLTPIAYENNLLGQPLVGQNQQIFDRFLDQCIQLAENES